MDLIMGLRRAVKLFPGNLAGLDGDRPYTWGEFEDRNRRLAAGLQELGVGKGDRVAILMLNRFQYLELYYAVMRLGAVVVPLNTRYAPSELVYVINDSECGVLFCDEPCAPTVAKIRAELPTVRHFVRQGSAAIDGFLNYDSLLESSPLNREVELEDNDLAGIFYTGGTTGKAKGVMLTQRNLASNALHVTLVRSTAPGDRWFHVAPMFHLADLSSTFGFTHSGGGHAFLPHFEARQVLDIISRHKITDTTLVPTMINLLLQVPELEQYDLSSLKTIGYGAAAMPVELLRQAMSRFKCDFRQGYGLSEASPLATNLSIEDHRAALAASPDSIEARRLRSAGRPIIGVEVKVVNEQGQEVQPGEVGEVIIRGPNVMAGYWKLPDETAEALRNGWLYTGDLAIIDEGYYIYIVDRRKDMIITGGENVYSLEVENVLYQHPAVLETAVVGVPDAHWGERVHAVVVAKPGKEVTSEELIHFCRERIAHYKAPRSLEFVEALPKSGAGKILKRNLRDKYWH